MQVLPCLPNILHTLFCCTISHMPDIPCCWYRPFVWKDQIYLGHWVAYLPAQERIAISVLNLEKGRTELVHRFSSLSKEIEESVWPEELVPKVSHSLRRGLLPAKPKPGTQPAFRCRIPARFEIRGPPAWSPASYTPLLPVARTYCARFHHVACCVPQTAKKHQCACLEVILLILLADQSIDTGVWVPLITKCS